MWLNVPEVSVVIIMTVVDLFHASSLMLDDIQDSSNLRRGMPTTHTVFGLGQTINSASYNITRALDNVARLGSLDCVKITLGKLYCRTETYNI